MLVVGLLAKCQAAFVKIQVNTEQRTTMNALGRVSSTMIPR
jgi:stage V sporulation protein SpoVS